MFTEFKENYMEMNREILTKARVKRLVLSRVKGDDDEIEKCLIWLNAIKNCRTYFEARQRFKELDDELLAQYKVMSMMDLPEVKYRREAFRALRNIWIETMPNILRRKIHGSDTDGLKDLREQSASAGGFDGENKTSNAGVQHSHSSDDECADN